jgi:hypothetical protein
MTDELREALQQVEAKGGFLASAAADLSLGTALVRIMDAARAHLGCSTITDEPTPEVLERMAKALHSLAVEASPWVHHPSRLQCNCRRRALAAWRAEHAEEQT